MERMILNRREFLGIGVAAGAAVILGGCGAGENSKESYTFSGEIGGMSSTEVQGINLGFAEYLEDQLGMKSDMTREELAVKIFEKENDGDFLSGKREVASFINNRAEKIVLGLSNSGEQVLEGEDDLKEFEYVSKNSQGYDMPVNQHRFHIFGPEEMVSEYLEPERENEVNAFMNGFVGSSETPVTFYLNFLSYKRKLDLSADRIISYPEFYPRGGTIRGGGSEPFYYVFVNMNMIHMEAKQVGLSVEQAVRKTTVNEAVNLMGNFEADRRRVSTKSNQAPSTIAGYAAAFHPEYWDVFLGGDSFTNMISHWSESMNKMAMK